VMISSLNSPRLNQIQVLCRNFPSVEFGDEDETRPDPTESANALHSSLTVLWKLHPLLHTS
jgi:hypothetical protein